MFYLLGMLLPPKKEKGIEEELEWIGGKIIWGWDGEEADQGQAIEHWKAVEEPRWES